MTDSKVPLRCICVALPLSLVFPASIHAETANWNQFRGPNGQGVAEADHLPAEFDPETKALWKTALPEGNSSPIVWDDRIFLTANEATDTKTLITLCINREDGSILWRKVVQAESRVRYHPMNNPSAPTPAADAERVFVYFGTFGLLCYDHAGNEVWRRPIKAPRNSYGMATSPILYGDTMIQVLDDNRGASRMLAVRRDTGKTVWEQPRLFMKSGWSTPTIWRHDTAEELVVLGAGRLTSYNPSTGDDIWWAGEMPRETVGVPVTGEGLLFVSAASLGGRGETTWDAQPMWEIVCEDFDRNNDNQIQRSEMDDGFVIPFRPDLSKDVSGYAYHERDPDKLMTWFDTNKDRIISEEEWFEQMKSFLSLDEPILLAIRPGATRNARETHVAWEVRRGIPEIPSPLYYKGRLYLLRNGGVLTCLRASSGQELFREPICALGQYSASPIAGDDKIIAASVRGTVTVIQADDTLHILSRTDFGEKIYATPAIADNTLYLRTTEHLYALGE